MNTDIIIIGGGIAGLSLAYFLEFNKFNVKVLERDINVKSRKQGFSLTMQKNTKSILEKYNLLDKIISLGKRARKQVFYDDKGNIIHIDRYNDSSRFNYPLPRKDILQLFIDRLNSETIVWNSKVTNIEINEEYTTVILENNQKYIAKYVVACDGLNSTIRKKFLPDIVPNDLKLYNIYGLVDISKVSQNCREHFDETEIQILDGNHRFFSKPYDENKQMWELTWNEAEEVLRGDHEDQRQYALDMSKKEIKEWPIPWLQEFMDNTKSEDILVHPLYDIDPKEINFNKLYDVTHRIIFIGDTIHSMAPYIGMGANEAFFDAFNVCEMFINMRKFNYENYKQHIETFHEECAERTQKTVLRSRENVKFYHSSDACDKQKLYKFKKWDIL